MNTSNTNTGANNNPFLNPQRYEEEEDDAVDAMEMAPSDTSYD